MSTIRDEKKNSTIFSLRLDETYIACKTSESCEKFQLTLSSRCNFVLLDVQSPAPFAGSAPGASLNLLCLVLVFCISQNRSEKCPSLSSWNPRWRRWSLATVNLSNGPELQQRPRILLVKFHFFWRISSLCEGTTSNEQSPANEFHFLFMEPMNRT